MASSEVLEDFHVRIRDEETLRKWNELNEKYEDLTGNYGDQGTALMVIHAAHWVLEKYEAILEVFKYGSDF